MAKIAGAVARSRNADDRLRAVVRILSDGRPHFTWTGIYLLKGDLLVLHNQIGRPTPHETIPIGQGICGLAARERQTVVVPDVGRDARYLACSLATRSEIVVPIFRGAAVAGEIDVDSDLPDAFDEEDRRLLEAAARIVGEAMEAEAARAPGLVRSGQQAREFPLQEPVDPQAAARGGGVDGHE